MWFVQRWDNPTICVTWGISCWDVYKLCSKLCERLGLGVIKPNVLHDILNMLTKLFISEYIVCVISGIFIKGDILYSNDNAGRWDPDVVDVCEVVAYKVPNMGPRLQLLHSQTTLFQDERVCTTSKDFQVC